MKKLAIITTHPIQYNAPLFALLSKRANIAIRVFYTWGASVLEEKYDPGFGKKINWDIPLLEGYEYSFVKNVSKQPGSKSYKGIDNPNIVKDISHWGADAVLVYGWNFKSHLKVIRFFKNKIPVFFRGDSTLLRKESSLKAIARLLFLRFVYHHIDTAFYVGTYNKNYFKYYGMGEEQLVFAPHAIDNDRFGKDHDILLSKANEKRRSMGIPDNALVILYAGKLEPVKNVGLVIKVANALVDKNIHFIIAGNGPEENELKLTAGKNVHFMDFQNQQNMPLIYRLGNVFLLPSVSETWGLGINEAMACARAIIASDNCGASTDLVKDGENGYIFQSGNAEDLKEKILSLYDKREEIDIMGLNSKRIISQWSFEYVADAIEKRLKVFKEKNV